MRWRRPAKITIVLAWWLGLAFTGSGCAFGPKVLERTHSRYNDSIRRVYEEQLLQNLVRMRYDEAPFRLNVSSIAAQYELAGGAEARPFFLAPNPGNNPYRTFTSVLPDVNLSGANRPTISFIPSSSEGLRRFLTPISADTLVFLASTSWPASTILRLYAERLNGVPNAPSASGPQREFAPDFARFQRIAHLLQVAQDLELVVVSPQERDTEVSGPLPAAAVTASAALEAAKDTMEYRPRGDGSSWVLVRKEHKLVLVVNPAAIGHPIMVELEQLLNLEPGQSRYDLIVASDVFDPLRAPTSPSSVLRLTPRSTVQVYYYLANGVEVPPEHLAAGLIRHLRGSRRRAGQLAGRHGGTLRGPHLPGTQATASGLCRGQVPWVLVLHRRPRPAEQDDIRAGPSGQSVGLRPPGGCERPLPDAAGREVRFSRSFPPTHETRHRPGLPSRTLVL